MKMSLIQFSPKVFEYKENNNKILLFCFFDNFHDITSNVKCNTGYRVIFINIPGEPNKTV